MPSFRAVTATKHLDTDTIRERRCCTFREKVPLRFLGGRGPILIRSRWATRAAEFAAYHAVQPSAPSARVSHPPLSFSKTRQTLAHTYCLQVALTSISTSARSVICCQLFSSPSGCRVGVNSVRGAEGPRSLLGSVSLALYTATMSGQAGTATITPPRGHPWHVVGSRV